MSDKPTIHYLRECFDYNAENGTLIWKYRPRSHFSTEESWLMAKARDAGKPVKGGMNGGYMTVQLRGKKYKMHRVIWAMVHGIDMDEVPPAIDHVDLDKTNNREANLRAATWSENCMNKGLQENNTSGFKGVHWHKYHQKWAAKVKINGKQIHLGYFADPEVASKVRERAANDIHGEFARHATYLDGVA